LRDRSNEAATCSIYTIVIINILIIIYQRHHRPTGPINLLLLTPYSQGLQTAQGIYYSLSNLYELLARNHISPRRASVLAYINSLLLRTLPAIDADNQIAIIDPTKPKPLTIPVPDQVIDSGADSELDPALEPPAASSTPPHKPRVSHSANTWDPSLSESDPNKKPS